LWSQISQLLRSFKRLAHVWIEQQTSLPHDPKLIISNPLGLHNKGIKMWSLGDGQQVCPRKQKKITFHSTY
jgi:hypothetical protein